MAHGNQHAHLNEHGKRARNAAAADIPPARAAQRAHVQRALLAWYAAHGRDLPWRHTRDPYAVLVSEVMLQQTQVERVLPKYAEFLRRFPTLAALAAAPVAEVIRAWAPLGYNVRAVRLQQIARQARDTYGGSLPATLDGLLALKGIGRYTAGAIACFAFGLPIATVDTNIRRVLWRVFRGIEPPVWPAGQAATRAALELAAWALPPDHAYAWQQALMDFGATICGSRRPACERCPLSASCAAYAEVASTTLFPSGEALTRLRDARTKRVPAAAPVALPRVAEQAGTYATSDAGDAHPGDPGDPGDPGAPTSVPRRGAGSRPRQRSGTVPFTSTTRYFRGRVLAALRAEQPDILLSLRELGPRVKPGWTEASVGWLREIVVGLERDGLVRLVSLDAEGGSDAALRVALP